MARPSTQLSLIFSPRNHILPNWRLASKILSSSLCIKTKLQQRIFAAPLARSHESNWDFALRVSISNFASVFSTLGNDIACWNGYGRKAAEVSEPDVFHAFECIISVIDAIR